MKYKEIDIFDFLYDKLYFDINKPIRLFEAFSGIGTQAMALKRLGYQVDHIGISEIDKHALKSYYAIHGEVKNYGGIGSFERMPRDIDICSWSFPCQDISLAGKQRGMVDGSRSNYGYVFLDTIENTPYEERPKVLLMENVKALLSETFSEDWEKINLRLEKLGYKNYAESLIATDFGVPQTRDRVFIVSIKGEYSYTFPKPFKLQKKLKDYLEDEVDEKYYLTFRQLQKLTTQIEKPFNKKIDSVIIPEATKQGYSIAEDGDGIYINRPHQKRGVVQKDKIQTIKTQVSDIGVVIDTENYIHIESLGGIDNSRRAYKIDKVSPTLTTRSDNAKILVEENDISIKGSNLNNQYALEIDGKGYIYVSGKLYRIRKLTPLEAWRLMGIDDEDFYKAKASGMSDSQLYKQAGNAIVVDVLYYIFKQFIKGEKDDI